MSHTIFNCLGDEMECLISQAQVSWGKLLTKYMCYEMVVSMGKNIIYVDENKGNIGGDMNWFQTVRPKFDHQFCFNELGNGHYVKYLASKSICSDFSMNVPWKQWSAPWAAAAVRKLTALLLTLESVSPSAPPSAVIISVLNILSRNPSENISVWISLENNSAHLELWQQWKFQPHCISCWNLDHLVHV